MDYIKKYRLMLWAVIVLMVFNVAAISSFIIHRNTEQQTMILPPERPGMGRMHPPRQLGRYFNEHLGLSHAQQMQFRDYRKEFSFQARMIKDSIVMVRNAWLYELSKPNTDTVEMERLSATIGKLHSHLKVITAGYYLKLKHVCNPEQQKRLYEIFNRMQNMPMEPMDNEFR